MIGLLYLVLNFTVGWAICSYVLPELGALTRLDYRKRDISVSPFLILLPSWYVTGTLAMTWATYLLGLVFQNKEQPLFYANLIVIPVAFLGSVLTYLVRKRKALPKVAILCNNKRSLHIEEILTAGVFILAFLLMWTTFFIHGDKLYIGVSVFSDFSPHVGMIRSFSYGNNFPTWYPHYAGEDIKYHFMFQFLAGNLEYLGLRLDYAFNLPSMISFISAFFLLYVLAVKISGKSGVGILACLFFAFRSSKTLFTYLSRLPKGTNLWDELASNMEFISDTPNEDWGLWNLNVYCNQRHLAFGLTVIFLVIILFLPRLYALFHGLEQPSSDSANINDSTGKSVIDTFRYLFLTGDGWKVKDFRLSIAVGILLGSLSFFHGAAVIGCLLVLFVMAILSNRRLEYAIVAGIAILMSVLQTKLFINGSAVEPEFLFGFIAENKTIFGVASYLDRLLGILPIVLIVALCLEKKVGKYLILAFTAPMIFAFTVSLTVDVTVNHKYIMISCILLGIYAAKTVWMLFEDRSVIRKLIGAIAILLLTSTGIYDFTTVLKKNSPDNAIVLDLKDPLTQWVKENTTSRDIFLTSNYTINQLVLGGAMMYEGWPYYPWSAGYDTYGREEKVKQMYEAATPAELMKLIRENGIRYIVIDRDNRESTDYTVNEENIQATYECVYEEGEGVNKLSIYDTNKMH